MHRIADRAKDNSSLKFDFEKVILVVNWLDDGSLSKRRRYILCDLMRGKLQKMIL
jgi:hypothetical protein